MHTTLQAKLKRNKDGDPVPTLPPKDPRDIGPDAAVKQSSIGLPSWLWTRIEEICASEGYTRNELFREVLRQLVDEFDAKKPARKSSK